MEPATERGQEAFIFGGNGCSGFGRKASETPGGMRSIGKKKGGGVDLVSGEQANKRSGKQSAASMTATLLHLYGGKWDRLRNRLKGLLEKW